MTKEGLLIVLSGPSGAGKGTVGDLVFERLPDLKKSVSVTTRPPRPGETDGVHYFFKTVEQYNALLEGNEFLETANVYGNYYGTLKSQVLDTVKNGYDIMVEIDIQGARLIKQSYPHCVRIFILPPSIEELKKRLIGRKTESEEAINRRLSETLNEINEAQKYDYIVINDDAHRAAQDVVNIINSEKLKTDRNLNLITKIIGEINTL